MNEKLRQYLQMAVDKHASDVFIVAGAPVSMKLGGKVTAVGEQKNLPPETSVLLEELYRLAGRSMDTLERTGDDDYSFAMPGLARFRVNAYRQRGSLAAVIRVVAFEIPDWQERRIPENIIKLSEITKGMVLFTGTAGSGKSTTQACIIDRINHNRPCHIITLEDPIEYLYRNDRSIVSQREIAIDSVDYPAALRACLRQAPDVIQLGEMRDLPTIRAAMTAAETGHLVFATLHTRGAVNSIDRIVDAFPAEQQGQIRIQLSSVLRTVVSQCLLPDTMGGRVPAFEIMHMNSAIRNLIREQKNHQIDNVISTSSQEGMIPMDRYVLRLYEDGIIARETALDFVENPQVLTRPTGGFHKY